ncbi:hypothetical protein PVAG01_10611 [Phlyctema vagabunda]|uniref:Oxidase ustYa n=1 Tax=Phlyctema vagabunda TaxID=108571 RepID=A0ABR4P2S8_9HELO
MSFENEAREALIAGDDGFIREKRRRFSYNVVIPWTISVFFFCTTLFLGLQQRPSQICDRDIFSFERGFQTDFVSSEDPIPLILVEKKFTNDLLFNATSQDFYNQPNDSSEITYIGNPSPIIDKAWHDLLHAQYTAITPAEAAQFPASHIEPIWYNGDHSFMELSVFHNLHCLNEIRVALDKGSEQKHGSIHGGRVHLDHCVDQIRQALMCHADLTPVPMLPVKDSISDLYIGNGETHTCRDFDAIWSWVERRGKEQAALGD